MLTQPTSLFTGLYPANSLVTDTLTYNDTPPQPTYSYLETMISWYLPNMAKLLKMSGYSVVYKGKWHLIKPMNSCTWTQNDVAMVAEIGFDEWDYPDAGEDTKPEHFGGGTADNDGRYLNDPITYVQQLDRTKGPFALILWLVNPHDVLAYPQTWQGQYPPKMLLGDIQLPPMIVEDLSSKPRCQAQVLQKMNLALGRLSTERDQLDYINFYANLQKKVDHQMGQLLDALGGSPFAGGHRDLPPGRSRRDGTLAQWIPAEGVRHLRRGYSHPPDHLQPEDVSRAAGDPIAGDHGRSHANSGPADRYPSAQKLVFRWGRPHANSRGSESVRSE